MTATAGEDGATAGAGSALARVPLFAGLDQTSIAALEAFAFQRTFAPGEVIVEEGHTGNGLFVVLDGQVEVVKGLGSDRPQSLATLGPGEPFGEIALLGEWKRSASVRAAKETRCLGMDRWVFLAHLRREPELALRVIQFLAQRLVETDERLQR